MDALGDPPRPIRPADDKRRRRAERRARLRAWRQAQRTPQRVLDAALFIGFDAASPVDAALARWTGDPTDWWLSASMRAALEALLPLIAQHAGVFLVTGDAGAGKTVFAARLATELRRAGHAVLIGDAAGLAAFDGTGDGGGAALVLLQDDADVLPVERLRGLVPRFEVAVDGAAGGMRLVLIGRPALRQQLDAPELTALRQQLRYHGHLEPLRESDIEGLIRHLLPPALAATPLPRELIAALAAHSVGKPGRVSVLWTRAARLAQSFGAALPTPADVAQAARSLQPQHRRSVALPVPVPAAPRRAAPRRKPSRRHARGIVIAASAAAAALLAWLVTPFDPPPTPSASVVAIVQPEPPAAPKLALPADHAVADATPAPSITPTRVAPPERVADAEMPPAAPALVPPVPSADHAVADATPAPSTTSEPVAPPDRVAAADVPPVGHDAVDHEVAAASPTSIVPQAAAPDHIADAAAPPVAAGPDHAAAVASPPVTVAPSPAPPAERKVASPERPSHDPQPAPVAVATAAPSVHAPVRSRDKSNVEHRQVARQETTPRHQPDQPMRIARLPESRPATPSASTPPVWTPPASTPPASTATAPPAAVQPTAPARAQLASADAQCRPYLSNVDFIGHVAHVQGMACRDGSGGWWVMDQRME